MTGHGNDSFIKWCIEHHIPQDIRDLMIKLDELNHDEIFGKNSKSRSAFESTKNIFQQSGYLQSLIKDEYFKVLFEDILLECLRSGLSRREAFSDSPLRNDPAPGVP